MIPRLFPSRGLIVPKSSTDLEVKDSSFGLLPKGVYGPNYSFFSPDGGQTIINIGDMAGHTALAFIAYWYVATRWRAQKIAEAPLMVVAEDQESGDEEWLPDHPLVGILDEPSPDYDMGELIETTSHYLDNTGRALWVIDPDRASRPARITPFAAGEFEMKGDGTRLYSTFRVQTSDGPQDFAADVCCLFRDAQGATSWGKGRSRLDVALSWLKLGAKATQTIHDLLGNSMWPSAVMVPDKEWNPDPKTFAAYKQDLEQYARQGNKGKPFVALGGGQFTALAAQIKDLVPGDILNRVESVVAAVSGVPAIVLQFQVGMENSPWSQMAQARRMAYDDTIVPSWRKFERVLTRQLLRPNDEDTTHYIRFDRSQIASLQRDQLESVQIATMMGDQASLNERRTIMGLEPDTDPKADEIPELVKPSFADVLAGMQSGKKPDPNADPNAPVDESSDSAKDDTNKKARFKLKHRHRTQEEKFRAPQLINSFRESAKVIWQATSAIQLHKDAQAISDLVSSLLTNVPSKSAEGRARNKSRVMDAVDRYLDGEGKRNWTKAIAPLAKQGAERAGAVIAADLDVAFTTIHPHLIKFAQRETATLIKGVNKTTRSLVSDIVQGGLDQGATNDQIAGLIKDATGFSTARAKTIARTETTKAFNGAPEESLAEFGKASGRIFTKEWSTAGDEKVRDEHVDLEGETVPVGEEFSNGLLYPSEPNCRCSSLFDEVEE